VIHFKTSDAIPFLLPVGIMLGTLVLGLWPRDRGSDLLKTLVCVVLIVLIAIWAHWY